MQWRLVAALAVSMAAWPSAWARADSILTKAGGILRGELQSAETELATAADITIRTLSGANVTLARDEIDHVVRRNPVLEEYDVRRWAAADTADGQWALGLWCHQNSLFEERNQHLRRVIDFERSHKGARRMLGHYKHGGRWWKPGESLPQSDFVSFRAQFALLPDWEAFQNGDLSLEENSWAARLLTTRLPVLPIF